ncbi:MAG TPA: serine hydrolase [Thermoanaerobaculia bacterium]|nr:serine hydrolase [Thermoanaerobaculia bacterium]
MTPVSKRVLVLALVALALSGALFAAEAPQAATAAKLKDFDAWMNQTIKDWNVPGIAVGIVVGDKLVFAKGYGYRDYGAKLPFTPNTLYQIASNSKLFTAVAAGLLVEEGKLAWDKPVRESVPSIHFYDDYLDQTITLRDMLAHRTGITRHDSIWYMAPDSRKELFAKLKFMEPKEAPRTVFLYNNMMYAAVGYLIELQSGKTWEDFVRDRIFKPLEMDHTLYSIADMVKQPDYGVAYTEKRDSFEIYKIPYYEDTAGMAPAGAIISNLEDMSHWLIALMNEGKYKGRQVIPSPVLKATLQPAIALPNTQGELRGWWEILNTYYGMGRWTTSYRGRLLAYHGGDLDGFHSQVSFMPQEKVGVLVAVIGNHASILYNLVSYNVYERLLGMDQTPWIKRYLDIRLKGKKAATEARGKAGLDQVKNTKPSHPLSDYVGDYEHPAYGLLRIGMKDGALQYDFHKVVLPMSHFHYDRFDTPDDEHYGKSSVNFLTNPQGDVDRAVMSLDEAEATFVRRPEKLDAAVLKQLAGTYETQTGAKFQVVLKEDGSLFLAFVGQPERKLIPYKGLKFRIPEFSDVTWEFVMENGQVKALKQRDPSAEFTFPRR